MEGLDQLATRGSACRALSFINHARPMFGLILSPKDACMIRLFLRSRTPHLLRERFRGELGFRARSSERDAESDRARVVAIVDAIEIALHSAEREQSGLNQRVEDVLV